MGKKVVEIAVTLPLEKTFYYSVPEELASRALIGMRATVPFGKRKVTGYIVGFPDYRGNTACPVSPFELKDIKDIPDQEPSFTLDMLRFYRWVSDYYLSPLGEVIKTALPPMKGTRKGIPEITINPSPPFELTKPQKEAVSEIITAMDKDHFSPFLLHGVTGSGKTEVYLQVIDEGLKRRKGAIVLVPEISLTPQLLNRFGSRFGNKIATLHSALPDGERYREWRRVKTGEASIVIGTRSAIFAPLNNLGIIVIDEEHDQSYKQEESPRYNARDIALVRGKMAKGIVVLGSATPAMESYHNAMKGKFRYIGLPARVRGRPMPNIQIVDMKDTGKRQTFSSQMTESIKECLSENKQVILFLNRRGAYTSLICSSCGFTFKCPNCSISLVYHKGAGLLKCHYCDHSQKAIPLCPNCKGGEAGLLGLGTERVEDEINGLFPDARVARMDRDTVSRKGSHERIFKMLEERTVDILIGTQMITKGHDYPGIKMVGIISADTSLNFPDFRAAEKTFQMITQVAGRAGRGEEPGNVVIQTFNPDHYSIRAATAQDMKAFYEEELLFRKELGYPPFSRLINIRLKGNSEKKTAKAAQHLGNIGRDELRMWKGIEFLGPSIAPIYKMRGKYRWHMLVKGGQSDSLHSFVRKVISRTKNSADFKGVDIQVDVDPISML